MKADNGVLILQNATGGRIFKTSANFSKFHEEKIQIKIYGICASACTLVLLYDNVCYKSDSKFIFHGASDNGVYDKSMSETMRNALPPKLSKWIKDHNAMSDPNKFITLDGSEIAKLDYKDRICK